MRPLPGSAVDGRLQRCLVHAATGERLVRGPIVFIMAWLVFAVAGSAHASETGDRCAALKAFAWPHLQVEEARLVAEGPAEIPAGAPSPGAPLQLPQHCLFRAVISPRTSAAGQRLGVGFELRLPTAWNGRFLFEGGVRARTSPHLAFALRP